MLDSSSVAVAPPYDDRTLQRAKLVPKAELILGLVLFLFLSLGWLRAMLMLQFIMPVAIIGFVARRPDLFSFAFSSPVSGSGRTHWLGSTYIANMFVFYAAFHEVQNVEWSRMVELAAASGVLLFSVSILADATTRRRRDWAGMVVLFLFNAFYAYGAIFEANILLDRSPASVQESAVADKRHVYGRGGGFRLNVRSWGPIRKDKNVWVSADVYRSVHNGGPVCMVLRPGALGVAWYTAQSCPWNGGKVELGDSLTSPY
jgi:hypothetical protein